MPKPSASGKGRLAVHMPHDKGGAHGSKHAKSSSAASLLSKATEKPLYTPVLGRDPSYDDSTIDGAEDHASPPSGKGDVPLDKANLDDDKSFPSVSKDDERR